MDLDALKANLKKDFQEIVSQEELNQLKVKYLGKKGRLLSFQKILKNYLQRKGQLFEKKIGELRSLYEDLLSSVQEKIELQVINESFEKDRIDVTLPGSF